MISPVPLCIHSILSSKRIPSSIMPMIDSVWMFLPHWGDVVLDIGTRESSFPFGASDRVGPRRWSTEAQHNGVMKHNPILQGTMSSTHVRKSCMRDREVLLLSIVSISFFLHGQCIFHRFLCPLLHKSRDEISFKGKDCNTLC
jgi:hypothetical protein